MNCLNCNKEIVQTEGKRERKYCSDKCRASYGQRNGAKKEKKQQIMDLNKEAEPIGKPFKPTKIEMPKGLTASEQLQWRIENNQF